MLEKILLDPKKRGDWENQLRSMVSRVQAVRRELRQRLEVLVPAYNWESITQQVSHHTSFPTFSLFMQFCPYLGAQDYEELLINDVIIV